ncbi:glycoside hydrolase family 125 protein, partial [Aureobasidium melanogenum]
MLPNLLSLLALRFGVAIAQCPDFFDYSMVKHYPYSGGVHNISYQRPDPSCRTFNLSVLEDQVILDVMHATPDLDLFRLFLNAYPNTLDTAIRWKGYAADSPDEELTFVVTGDIDAMWLRDSSNQMQSYLPLLTANSSVDSLASLFRGVINLQARYLLTSPYCNAFQPPVESGIAPATNPSASQDVVFPTYDNASVFECKYELDSLAAFLQISSDYYNATGDVAFFAKHHWIEAINHVYQLFESLQSASTYAADGRVQESNYTFTRVSDRATETLANDGLGNPYSGGTGLLRSAFRPSDDATIYQYLIPANMMLAHYLEATAPIMLALNNSASTVTSVQMTQLASSIRQGIEDHGIVTVNGKQVYAYEVDGYGSANIMDDANIPSLLSAPFLGYLDVNDEVYQNTRSLLLSTRNPYFMRGAIISAIGGPHQGPGYAWPMASIVRILTSDNDTEITEQLVMILNSTDGLGLIHESINTFNQSDYTRPWFSWANGLFGQMILDLYDRKPQILAQSFQ